jgi:hypothetical protein
MSRFLALVLAATVAASPAVAGDWHGGGYHGGYGWHGGCARRQLRVVLGGLRARRAGPRRRAGCALRLRATASLLSAASLLPAALPLSAGWVSAARVWVSAGILPSALALETQPATGRLLLTRLFAPALLDRSAP